MKTMRLNLYICLLFCVHTAQAGDYQGQLSASDRSQIEAAIDKNWPKAQLAAMQGIASRNSYQIDRIDLITSKPELFAVVAFEERSMTDTRGQVLTVTCRMRIDWQCGSPLAHHYVHWPNQGQRIYLNVDVDENVAFDAFSYVIALPNLKTDAGTALLTDRQKPIIKNISKTGRGDLLVTVANPDGSKTGRVFIRPTFSAQSANTFSTIDSTSYRNSFDATDNTEQ